MKAEVKTLDNEPAGEIELNDAIFGIAPRVDILHRVVTWQQAKRRSGNHKVQERSEVSGSTAKIWKQKGTGRARHGNRKAPQFRGGGVAFGPRVRDHAHKLPKKIRSLGLKCALSAKQADGTLVVLDDAKLDAPKTKLLNEKLKALGTERILIIDGDAVDANLKLAIGNVHSASALPAAGANVYDILKHDTLALTKAAVASLEARLS